MGGPINEYHDFRDTHKFIRDMFLIVEKERQVLSRNWAQEKMFKAGYILSMKVKQIELHKVSKCCKNVSHKS